MQHTCFILKVLDGRGSDDSAVDVEMFDKQNLVEVLLHQGVCIVLKIRINSKIGFVIILFAKKFKRSTF